LLSSGFNTFMCNILEHSSFEIYLMVFNPILFSFIAFIQTILVCGMPHVKATSVSSNIRRTPSSARMPFPIPFSMLLSSMRNVVPSHIMVFIDAQYALLMVCKWCPIYVYVLNSKISLMYHVVLVQSNRISRDDFMSKLRSVVGNDVLKSAIHNVVSKVQFFFF
jgi:hypothetical protein